MPKMAAEAAIFDILILFFIDFSGPAAWPGQPATGWPAQPGTNRANTTNRLTGYPTGDGLSPLARQLFWHTGAKMWSKKSTNESSMM